MKTKQIPFTQRLLAFAITLALLIAGAPVVSAVDVQTLPENTQAATGFTHAALVTWDDLNAADASVVSVPLFAIPTNSYIDRLAFYVEEQFTNAAYVPTLGGTNLVFALGVGGTTNAFFASNTLTYARSSLYTNMLVPYKATTSTNYLVATFSDGLQASEVDAYLKGRIRVMWRTVQPARLKF